MTGRFLVILGLLAGCQRTHAVDCDAREEEVGHFVSSLELRPDLELDPALHLVERAELDAVTRRAPFVTVLPGRTYFERERMTELDMLNNRLTAALAGIPGGASPPPLGLALDRAVPWSTVVELVELASRVGFERVELYYVAPPTTHVPPSGLAACPALERLVSDALAARPVRAVRLALDRVGPMHVHPPTTPWSEVAPSLTSGPGWLISR